MEKETEKPKNVIVPVKLSGRDIEKLNALALEQHRTYINMAEFFILEGLNGKRNQNSKIVSAEEKDICMGLETDLVNSQEQYRYLKVKFDKSENTIKDLLLEIDSLKNLKQTPHPIGASDISETPKINVLNITIAELQKEINKLKNKNQKLDVLNADLDLKLATLSLPDNELIADLQTDNTKLQTELTEALTTLSEYMSDNENENSTPETLPRDTLSYWENQVSGLTSQLSSVILEKNKVAKELADLVDGLDSRVDGSVYEKVLLASMEKDITIVNLNATIDNLNSTNTELLSIVPKTRLKALEENNRKLSEINSNLHNENVNFNENNMINTVP